ncbi:uncharacterized protein BDR25DRAFT_352786 [Lindgomyces ingoldianus]|uniref:Uncharacterized protein n=1 Tax=Lindgomyces ingoldianus TaxID=673940 RepID=A0ACB6R2L0_9PLEO|nr:uncharacterized protein BDR25DRAFT_352786 [Lindgomyces ingoldianus]KAF2473381.1 hypothetical protein BDR25DRAFT_352786 [Lindgomyces ingoldianus]
MQGESLEYDQESLSTTSLLSSWTMRTERAGGMRPRKLRSPLVKARETKATSWVGGLVHFLPSRDKYEDTFLRKTPALVTEDLHRRGSNKNKERPSKNVSDDQLVASRLFSHRIISRFRATTKWFYEKPSLPERPLASPVAERRGDSANLTYVYECERKAAGGPKMRYLWLLASPCLTAQSTSLELGRTSSQTSTYLSLITGHSFAFISKLNFVAIQASPSRKSSTSRSKGRDS